MNIWFMIWVFVAVLILGTALWSFWILIKQRRAWEAFATKNNLEFIRTRLSQSALVRGSFDGMPITLYADAQLAGRDRERNTLRTTLQIKLKAPMPTEGAIASTSFSNFVNGLSMPVQSIPDIPNWPSNTIIRVEDAEAIKPYLTPERINTFQALMGIKGNPALLIFSPEDTILRIESIDAFDSVDRLQRFVAKVVDAAKVLTL